MDPASRNLWFAEEVQPHESYLRSYLRRQFPGLPDVDDVVQESYLRLLRARESGGVQYVKALLFTTARNLALDFFRRRNVVRIDGVEDLESIAIAVDSPDAAEATHRQQELVDLATVLRELPERCRQVLTLRLLYGLSIAEIADRLEISKLTVKTQMARGMRRCAARLARRDARGFAGSVAAQPRA